MVGCGLWAPRAACSQQESLFWVWECGLELDVEGQQETLRSSLFGREIKECDGMRPAYRQLLKDELDISEILVSTFCPHL